MPQITCPHCGQKYDLTPEQTPQYSGQTITCTKCQKPFTVPQLSGGGSGVPGGPPPYPQPPQRPGGVPPYPAPHHGQPIEYGTPTQQRTNSWAIASLVSSCIGFVIPIVPGILGVIFGIIGLTKTRDPRVGGKGLAIAGISVGAFSIVALSCMLSIMLPSLNRARETANRVKCASNMRQIGQAILLYSNDNRGAYPDTLEQLLTTQDITAEVFTCPSSNDTRAPGADAKAQAAALHSGGHLSYVYVGKGLTNQASAETVVLYEPLTNHGNDGMNILYGDGHVAWEGRKYAEYLAKELQAGHNPAPPWKGQ